MNPFSHIFKSNAYKEGFNAGSIGKGSINNPYAEKATEDNISKGLGLSPWWNTEFKPFIDWELGRLDSRS